MSAWTDFATAHYNKNKHRSGYLFKDALKEAGKLYKKSSSAVPLSSTKKRSRSKSKSSRRSKRRRTHS